MARVRNQLPAALALLCAPWLSSSHKAVADDLSLHPVIEEECNAELDANAAAQEETKTLRFEKSRGRDCHRYRKRWVCEGPRKVPIAPDAAAKLQVQLDLVDSSKVGAKLLLGAPPSEWVAAAPKDAQRSLHLPIENGLVWRGPGRRGRGHKGVDLGAEEGTPIQAARAGLVVYSDNTLRGYGNLVGIVHSDGTSALYAHNLENHVAAGELVQRGQVIGLVGHTGLARGSHLHFELRRGGRATNPVDDFVPTPRKRTRPGRTIKR